ncbi:hypothetical protein Ancab_005592, partial [Ancistrocladus abbreviatus]
ISMPDLAATGFPTLDQLIDEVELTEHEDGDFIVAANSDGIDDEAEIDDLIIVESGVDDHVQSAALSSQSPQQKKGILIST